MIYGQSLSVQYDNFLFAVGFGVIVGILCNLYSVIVDVVGIKKIALIICDFLFAVSLSVLCFIFFFCINYGIVRLYLIAGIVIGTAVYYIGVGPYFFGGVKRFLISLKKYIKKTAGCISKNAKKLTKKT